MCALNHFVVMIDIPSDLFLTSVRLSSRTPNVTMASKNATAQIEASVLKSAYLC